MTAPASAAGAGAETPVPATPPENLTAQVALVDPPSPAELVEGMVATWRASLVEAAGTSTLVDVDELGDAVLDLSAAHPSGLAQLFAGRPTRLSSLVREVAALGTARRRARQVAARATVYTQQYGIAPTSLAIGVATWVERTVPDVATDDVAALASATKGGAAKGPKATSPTSELPEPRRVHAPVLLRPVTLRARGAAEADYELALEPTIEINPVLARALRARGALLDPGAVARATFTDTGFDPHGALARLASLGWAVLEDFQLTEKVVVGTFVHPGQVIVDDLDALAGAVGRHEVLAALAGVDAARDRLSRPLPTVRGGDRDPQLDRGLGDLDPAQQHLLDVVATGAHVFVDAPAGADVTGTLAALVADAAAAGRTVLYVPGHRRAAVALADRLERLGAGDLLLDVAPEAGWRSAATRRLLAAMTLEPPVVDDRSVGELQRALVAHREALRGYVRGLHTPRQPWNVSAYDALQELARLTSTRPTPRTMVRLDPDVARVLDGPGREKAAADLLRAGELGAYSLRPSDTPWYGADLRTAADATTALGRIDRLLGLLPDVMARAEAAAADIGLTAPATITGWAEQMRLIDEVRASLDLFQPLVFERTAADLVAATASKAWRAQHGVEMGRFVRRRLRRQARDMVRPGRPVADLHTALLDVQRRRELWQQHCPGGGWPRLPDGLEAMEADFEAVRADLDALDEVLTTTPEGRGLAALPMPDLLDRLARLKAGAGALDTLPRRTALVRHLRGAGLGALVDDLAERRVAATTAAAELDLAWWSTVFEQILALDPALAGYDGTTLDALSTRYAQLDRAHVAGLVGPVRGAAIKAMGSAMRQQREQAEGLFSELIEERVTSLRDVMARYPDVARRLRPVITASPMLVPQVLPPSRTVDLVVLDAATRTPVEVVVPAIARGRQIVVVGDARCASGSAVRELADVLPNLELHADASRRDPWLTAFLVAHGYDGALRPTPLPSSSPLVRLELVDGTGLPGVESGVVDSTREEVDRVVELVLDHAMTHPDESLAVVTATPRHADAVRDQVLGEARGNPALETLFDEGRADPFVVVDLASVAGLRRDALILSLGLGRTPHRRVLHSFGPISAPSGDALLLDALGSAQHRLTVVACFGAADVDQARLRGPGPRLLVDLLAFAERRGRGDADPLAPVVRLDDEAVGATVASAAPVTGPSAADEAEKQTAGLSAADEAGEPGAGPSAADEAERQAAGPSDEAGAPATDSTVGATADEADGTAGTSGETFPVAATPVRADETSGDATAVVPPDAGGTRAAERASSDEATRSLGADTDEPGPTTDATPPAPEPDRLVLDLAERLWRHGLTVEVDHGIPGGARIPLAVGHPDVPDRYLVAVLTDDQAYVDEPSVRVRDRLVPERLERLGWVVLRVWSAAAFLDPQAEVDRIRRAVHAAVPERVVLPVSPRTVPVVDDDSDGWAASGAVPVVAAASTGAVPVVAASSTGVVTEASARVPMTGMLDEVEYDVEPAPLAEVPSTDAEAKPVADSSHAPDGVGARADGDRQHARGTAAHGGRARGTGADGGRARKADADRDDARTVNGDADRRASEADGDRAGEAGADAGRRDADGVTLGSGVLDVSAIVPTGDLLLPRQQDGPDGGPRAPMSAPVRVPTGMVRKAPKPPRTGEVQLSLAVPARPRPDIRKGLPIGAYSDDQLDEMAEWLMSDGQERTRDELADALRAELGLTRRTHRVDSAVRAAVSRAMS
ncbi:MAG: hypothetical protein BGO37_06170 [Cellulomonas sp. 73-92]|nr:MAG: hypothetical protein BGO37_06170 [Cellulomonas sp. 73-92]